MLPIPAGPGSGASSGKEEQAKLQEVNTAICTATSLPSIMSRRTANKVKLRSSKLQIAIRGPESCWKIYVREANTASL